MIYPQARINQNSEHGRRYNQTAANLERGRRRHHPAHLSLLLPSIRNVSGRAYSVHSLQQRGLLVRVAGWNCRLRFRSLAVVSERDLPQRRGAERRHACLRHLAGCYPGGGDLLRRRDASGDRSVERILCKPRSDLRRRLRREASVDNLAGYPGAAVLFAALRRAGVAHRLACAHSAAAGPLTVSINLKLSRARRLGGRFLTRKSAAEIIRNLVKGGELYARMFGDIVVDALQHQQDLRP